MEKCFNMALFIIRRSFRRDEPGIVLPTITFRMFYMVRVDLAPHVRSLIIGQRSVSPAIGPAIGPAVPHGESRVAADAHTEIHCFGQDFVARSFLHAFSQPFIRFPAFIGCSALSVTGVMLQTAVAQAVS